MHEPTAVARTEARRREQSWPLDSPNSGPPAENLEPIPLSDDPRLPHRWPAQVEIYVLKTGEVLGYESSRHRALSVVADWNRRQSAFATYAGYRVRGTPSPGAKRLAKWPLHED